MAVFFISGCESLCNEPDCFPVRRRRLSLQREARPFGPGQSSWHGFHRLYPWDPWPKARVGRCPAFLSSISCRTDCAVPQASRAKRFFEPGKSMETPTQVTAPAANPAQSAWKLGTGAGARWLPETVVSIAPRIRHPIDIHW
jgi:hypothetical protein